MKLQHMTIFSKDINASVKFYEEVTGLSVVRDMRGGEHEVVFLNDGTQPFCLEIAQGDGPMLYNGGGVSLGVRCDDLDAEINRLKEMGITPGNVISPHPGVRFFFINDPDGFMVQFVEEA